MIKKLRIKFIRITMTIVFAVLSVIVIATNWINISRTNSSLDEITELLSDNGGSFQPGPMNDWEQKDNRPNAPDDFRGQFHNKKELPFSTRFFTVTLDDDGVIQDYNLKSIASVSEADLEVLVTDILEKNKDVGWCDSYRYRVSDTQNGSLLIVLEATNAHSTVASVLAITCGVALAAFLVIFCLVALVSKRAIRPIQETYDKQKQFITDAGHELKTPLTVISANTEILELMHGENEWSEGIRRQTEHMRALVGKLIQLAKLDEGSFILTKEEFNISDAVYDTVFSFQSIADARGLTLTANIPSDFRYTGDESAIRQVISILVDNALKYCDASGTIHTELRHTKTLGKEKYSINVQNTCANVSSLDLNKLFDRFYRADEAHTAGGSYGLGLSIAASIVEGHGGTLEAKAYGENEIAFCVVLPL